MRPGRACNIVCVRLYQIPPLASAYRAQTVHLQGPSSASFARARDELLVPANALEDGSPTLRAG